MGGREVVLNVDAGPNLVNVNGVTKLRLVLVIEYRPVTAESDTERTSTPSINEQLTVVLEDGKPLVVSQSADPSTDRKVKVEVKASILKLSGCCAVIWSTWRTSERLRGGGTVNSQTAKKISNSDFYRINYFT